VRRQLPVFGPELHVPVRQALAVSQDPRHDGDPGRVLRHRSHEARLQLHVVIGRKPPSWAIIATSIAVSAADMIACPQTTPPA
jgi:hypothetical protein